MRSSANSFRNGAVSCEVTGTCSCCDAEKYKTGHGDSQQRRRVSILCWRRSQTSARAPLGDGSRASLSVSERCSISHITCTSSYAHVWMSSWSFTSVPRPSESRRNKQGNERRDACGSPFLRPPE